MTASLAPRCTARLGRWPLSFMHAWHARSAPPARRARRSTAPPSCPQPAHQRGVEHNTVVVQLGIQLQQRACGEAHVYVCGRVGEGERGQAGRTRLAKTGTAKGSGEEVHSAGRRHKDWHSRRAARGPSFSLAAGSLEAVGDQQRRPRLPALGLPGCAGHLARLTAQKGIEGSGVHVAGCRKAHRGPLGVGHWPCTPHTAAQLKHPACRVSTSTAAPAARRLRPEPRPCHAPRSWFPARLRAKREGSAVLSPQLVGSSPLSRLLPRSSS